MRKTFFGLVLVAIMAPAAVAISASIAATFQNFGFHMENFNVGMMTALMSNIDAVSDSTTCVLGAKKTSHEIYKLLDFNGYLNGGFNFGIFLERINVVFLHLMQQFEYCEVNGLLI